jgi:hypothetical protein
MTTSLLHLTEQPLLSLSTGAGFRRFRAKADKKLSIVGFAAAIFKLRSRQVVREIFHELGLAALSSET